MGVKTKQLCVGAETAAPRLGEMGFDGATPVHLPISVSFIRIHHGPEPKTVRPPTEMDCRRDGNYNPENEYHQAPGILLANQGEEIGPRQMLL